MGIQYEVTDKMVAEAAEAYLAANPARFTCGHKEMRAALEAVMPGILRALDARVVPLENALRACLDVGYDERARIIKEALQGGDIHMRMEDMTYEMQLPEKVSRVWWNGKCIDLRKLA